MKPKVRRYQERFPEIMIGFPEIHLEKLREEDERLDQILSLYDTLLAQGTGDYGKLVERRFKAVMEYLREKESCTHKRYF